MFLSSNPEDGDERIAKNKKWLARGPLFSAIGG
jgi:hypothetical protein